jgi:precorrin-2 dehydrogenase/sirohydrochlorin ferrochelatase
MSATIPIFLKVDPARACLVVGGGEVARRKVEWLLGCGARVVVLAPEIGPALATLPARHPGALELRRTAYGAANQEIDWSGIQLAIAATNDETVNQAVASDARRAGVPFNVVDAPQSCSFYVPASLRRGALQIAIGTGGTAPSLAARLRRELETRYPEWLGRFAAALGRVRLELKARVPATETRGALLAALAAEETGEALKELDLEEMVAALRQRAEAWLAERG